MENLTNLEGRAALRVCAPPSPPLAVAEASLRRRGLRLHASTGTTVSHRGPTPPGPAPAVQGHPPPTCAMRSPGAGRHTSAPKQRMLTAQQPRPFLNASLQPATEAIAQLQLARCSCTPFAHFYFFDVCQPRYAQLDMGRCVSTSSCSLSSATLLLYACYPMTQFPYTFV